MNWLDIVVLLIIGLSVLTGLTRGFARVGIGMVAAVMGVILGLWFHGSIGSFFLEYVSAPYVANFLGFVIIFVGFLILGAAVGALLAHLFRWAGLGWLDRLIGGAFGLLRGVVVAAVLILVLMAFSQKPPPTSIVQSRVAPYIVDAASVLASIAPKSFKDGFQASYDRVKKAWAGLLHAGN